MTLDGKNYKAGSPEVWKGPCCSLFFRQLMKWGMTREVYPSGQLQVRVLLCSC